MPISPFLLLPSITAPAPFTLQSIILLQFDCFCNFTHVGRKHGNGKIVVLGNLEVWKSRKSQKYVRYDHIRIKSGLNRRTISRDKLGPKQTKNPSLRNKDKVSFEPRLSPNIFLAIIYCTSAIYDLIKEENFDGPQIAFSALSILLRFHCHNIRKNLLSDFNASATLTYSGIKSRTQLGFQICALNFTTPINNETIELKDAFAVFPIKPCLLSRR